MNVIHATPGGTVAVSQHSLAADLVTELLHDFVDFPMAQTRSIGVEIGTDDDADEEIIISNFELFIFTMSI